MASDLLCIPLLVGLGFDEFSVSAPQVPAVKHALRNLSYDKCKAMTSEVLKISDPEDILASCSALAIESYSELLSR
jgi:phosphoenolpyruvate-protein kinase (PTS system EI component)